MKALQIIEAAYRGTLEEQDDTIVWMTHSMLGAGAQLSVLLCGEAVSYAVRDQDAGGLSFGAWRQSHPPQLDRDIANLCNQSAPVYLLREDLARLGLEEERLVEGVTPISETDIPALLEAQDQIWHW